MRTRSRAGVEARVVAGGTWTRRVGCATATPLDARRTCWLNLNASDPPSISTRCRHRFAALRRAVMSGNEAGSGSPGFHPLGNADSNCARSAGGRAARSAGNDGPPTAAVAAIAPAGLVDAPSAAGFASRVGDSIDPPDTSASTVVASSPVPLAATGGGAEAAGASPVAAAADSAGFVSTTAGTARVNQLVRGRRLAAIPV
jgi:hypothetical protein